MKNLSCVSSDAHDCDHEVLSRSPTANRSDQNQEATALYPRNEVSGEDQFVARSLNRSSTGDAICSPSFEETAVWDRKAVLSLDGGGIRGYSALLMIRALMRTIEELERTWPDDPAESSFHPLLPPIATRSTSINSQSTVVSQRTTKSPWLPCHYFDYIAGTSTGGIISIMLGRLRMNIDDCIYNYETLGHKVFGHSRWFHLRSPLFWVRDKYNHKELEEVIRKVVSENVPHVARFPGGRNFAFDENRCRTVVLSYQKQKGKTVEKTYLFRTYKNLHRGHTLDERLLDRNPDFAHDIPIWQVARATSAAPTYFKPIKIDGLEYLDGGFGANNPTIEIYDEVRKMNNGSNQCIGIIVSVGTGKNNSTNRFGGTGLFRYLNYENFARKWASNSEKAHLDMLRTVHGSNVKLHYCRLNVEHGLDLMKMDEWRYRGSLRLRTGRCIATLRERPRKTKILDSAGNPNEDVIQKKTTNRMDASVLGRTPRIPKWFQPKNITLESIETHTSTYLEQTDVREWIQECAQILVQGRRERAKMDPLRWEKSCFRAWYQCVVKNCPRGEKEYESRSKIRRHLLNKHEAQLEKPIEEVLDACKILVR